MKNKDIIESGSKGSILMMKNRSHMVILLIVLNNFYFYQSRLAFIQYIDVLLDLMLVINGIIDLYKKDEFIFIGPDEGTADLMDIAAEMAKNK